MNRDIDVSLVRQLIAEQFPEWVDLQIKPVESGGWDNRTFHLGDHMSIRLPSAECYAANVEKEQYWLPKLAVLLPISIPTPLAMGRPSENYPWNWSVYKWIDGLPASPERIADMSKFATDLALFLIALQHVDTIGGPVAGKHNFYRGGPLATYNNEISQALSSLSDMLDVSTMRMIWNEALATTWQNPPVWVHGDIAVGNLLVEHGELSGVIDFGGLAVGDPSCDLVIAWTLFTGESRHAFREALSLDRATWVRACGWALWKALCCAFPGEKRIDWRVVNEVLADYKHEIAKGI